MIGSPYKVVRNSILEDLKSFLNSIDVKLNDEDILNSISLSRNFGDLSSNLIIRVSKSNHMNLKDLSEKLPAFIKNEYVEKISVENGFINFYLNRKSFLKLVLSSISDEKYDYVKSDLGKNTKVIVESPSVNPVHPWHVGQVRSALLGDTISNIMDAAGYKVEREDYIDDFGLQSAEALWGIVNKDKLDVEFNEDEKYDHYVGKLYVATNNFMNGNDQVMEEINQISKNMEVDGTYESQLLKDSVEKYIKAEYDTASKLNIHHDLLIWESDIVKNDLLSKALELLSNSKVTEKADEGKYAGCIVINYDKLNELPDYMNGLKEKVKVLIRSNGVADYLAKDIAFHMWKFGIIKNTFKFDKFMVQPDGKTLYTTNFNGSEMDFGNGRIIINTIDSRQSYEQDLVKLAISLIGGEDLASGFKHIAYGVVNLEDKKLAGRKGTWIGYTADDLIEESRDKALELIGDRFQLSDGEKNKIAEKIGISAIRYEFLKLSNEKELVFSWDKALNFEGNSGPYCEYMYARSSRILEKSKPKLNLKDLDGDYLSDDKAFDLIKGLSVCKDMIEKASRELKPNTIVEYLTDLSYKFSKFYESDKVIDPENKDSTDERLILVQCFNWVSNSLMNVLGITPIEKM